MADQASPKPSRVFAALMGAMVAGVYTPAMADPLFGGYDCGGDCSDHAAGYDWGERHDI